MNKSDRNCSKFWFKIAAIIPSCLVILLNPQPFIPQAQAQEIKQENSLVYVDPQIGNDSNQGGIHTPLKTITQALKIAQDYTVISLAPGNYNEETGEVFPLIIKNNITLKGVTGGQGNSVIIEGNGAFISHTAAEQNVTIAAIKNAGAITGVTVTNPHSRGNGLWIESANPQVSYSTFSRSGNTGLSINGNSNPVITNNYFYRNGGNGLLIYDNSQAQVSDNLFDNTGFGVSLVQNATSILSNNTFQGNRIAIILEGNSQGILRDNNITNSLENGLVAIAESKVDLGVSNQLGNNIFRNNKKLDIQNITPNIISAAGTEISGQTEGEIDFSNNAVSVVSIDSKVASLNTLDTANIDPLSSNSLPEKTQTEIVIQPSLPEAQPLVSDSAISASETLPPPPSVTNPLTNTDSITSSSSPSENQTAKEYIFAAPTANETQNLLPNAIPSDIKYRVLVETNNNTQLAQIKSLYPQAFSTVYQGRSMLQVGAFSDRSKAEIISRSLADLGLNSHILE